MQRTKHEEALMSQLANLNAAVRAKEKELEDYRISQSGVKVGDVVVTAKGRFKVTVVEPKSWGGKPWLKAAAEKKDGTFGARIVTVYGDWELESSDGR